MRDVEQDPRLSSNISPDFNEHQYVADEFIYHRSKAKKLIKIGENLSRLRQFRNKADYADTVYTLARDVKIALKIAQNIMTSLNELNRETES